MSTVSTPRKTRNVERRLRLLAPFDSEGKSAVLRITITSGVRKPKQEVFEYFLDRVPADFGEGFLLEKRGDHGDPEQDPTRYHVLFSPEGHTCECRGFLRHGHCKHLDALAKLRELDLI